MGKRVPVGKKCRRGRRDIKERLSGEEVGKGKGKGGMRGGGG